MSQRDSIKPTSKLFEVPYLVTDTHGLDEDLNSQLPIYIHGNTGSNKNTVRVYQTGEIWRYSDTKKVIKNGFPRREKVEWAWRYEGTVSKEGVEELKILLEESFRELESVERSKGDRDRGQHIRRAIYTDSYHQVVLPSGPIPEGYEIIQSIDNAIFHNMVAVEAKEEE